jgi:hypothetical protein
MHVSEEMKALGQNARFVVETCDMNVFGSSTPKETVDKA